MQSRSSEQQHLGEREAAKRIGVSRITLLRKRQQGEIGYYRIGKRVIYSHKQLCDFLSQCKQEPRKPKRKRVIKRAKV